MTTMTRARRAPKFKHGARFAVGDGQRSFVGCCTAHFCAALPRSDSDD